MKNVYRDSAASYATVARWVDKFKRGQTSLEDDRHAERPVEATTDDCCHATEMLFVSAIRSYYNIIQKYNLCCFGCVTWSLLHGVVNW